MPDPYLDGHTSGYQDRRTALQTERGFLPKLPGKRRIAVSTTKAQLPVIFFRSDLGMKIKRQTETTILTLGLLALLALNTFSTPVFAQSEPQVFFVTPTNGATVTSPVAFEFGSLNLTVSPVPEEVDQPRAGVSHYHIGFYTDCLSVGEEIPRADPWVHFGDGSATFETLLEPGDHTFAVPVGDDEHRTLEGLCSTITITVE